MQASSLPWMLCTLKRVVGITVKKQNKTKYKKASALEYSIFISVAVKLCLFAFGNLKNTEISRLN